MPLFSRHSVVRLQVTPPGFEYRHDGSFFFVTPRKNHKKKAGT
jgi:hypothetical protein